MTILIHIKLRSANLCKKALHALAASAVARQQARLKSEWNRRTL
ncbi:hypothetical protein [Rhizobium sp. CFBP 13726]|nr:hypothetical protein [Rhizobium sp. CFBP 13726]